MAQDPVLFPLNGKINVWCSTMMALATWSELCTAEQIHFSQTAQIFCPVIHVQSSGLNSYFPQQSYVCLKLNVWRLAFWTLAWLLLLSANRASTACWAEPSKHGISTDVHWEMPLCHPQASSFESWWCSSLTYLFPILQGLGEPVQVTG